ncbi:TPA: hypothetical protein ACRZZI_004975 [Vibrio harveyi]
MLEPVLAMYSVPSSPLYREVGSGLLTQESLKCAGAFAQRKSKLGWLVILSKSGDTPSQIEAIEHLIKEYGAVVASLSLFTIIPKVCKKCNGTGVYKWKSGNIRECKKCKDGFVTISHEEQCKELGVDVAKVDECIHKLLIEESDAIDEIKRVLQKERSA